MKLARDIVEELASELPLAWSTSQAESIIAARLEPVREALRSAWAGEVCGPEMCCECPACKHVAEIWELLSEEE